MELRWEKPKVVRKRAVESSINKAEYLCSSGSFGRIWEPSFSSRHGGEEKRGFLAPAWWYSDLQQGSDDASPGRFLTTASPPLFFMVKRRPLPPQASVTVSSGRHQMVYYNLQAAMPFRRPFGCSAAGSRLHVPSGVVPGYVEVGCAKLQFRHGGEGVGLDCIFQFYFEVLDANCKGVCVFSCVLEALSVRCTSTNGN
jgi:hypothetical protein